MLEPHRREYLGRVVRAAWVAWARQQANPKPSWLAPWEELGEPDREADRLIGETLWQCLGVYEDIFRIGNPTEDDPYRAERLAWEQISVMSPDYWIPGDWPKEAGDAQS